MEAAVSAIGFTERFFETTRGRVVDLLRRGVQTVDELASRLGLTDNAVRAHLAALERDGIVRETGVRRGPGAGKPASIYAITADAQPSLSHAYIPFLRTLLGTLADDVPRERLNRLMRDVGRRMAAGTALPDRAGVRERVALAATLLEELGGVATLTEERGTMRICGVGCPLSAVVANRPEVCGAMTAMISEIVGAEVRECCEHGDQPQCRFEIAVRGRR